MSKGPRWAAGQNGPITPRGVDKEGSYQIPILWLLITVHWVGATLFLVASAIQILDIFEKYVAQLALKLYITVGISHHATIHPMHIHWINHQHRTKHVKMGLSEKRLPQNPCGFSSSPKKIAEHGVDPTFSNPQQSEVTGGIPKSSKSLIIADHDLGLWRARFRKG